MVFDMDNNCKLVVFSDKAYNAIIRETFEWDPVETGGILLGHILDNGYWIVMEVLPPGYGEGREGDNVFHEYGYFEYNRKFVNYLAKSVSEQYEIPLELLGLWHRHPGSMDHFSGTDNVTNSTFAAQNPHGVISGLINIDPQLRMTMYYLPHNGGVSRYSGRPNYQVVDIEVGSDLIPEEYFKLRYFQGEENQLHPYAPQRKRGQHNPSRYSGEPMDQIERDQHNEVGSETTDTKRTLTDQIPKEDSNSARKETLNAKQQEPLSAISNFTESLKKNKSWVILIISMAAFVLSIFSIKNDVVKAFHFFDDQKKAPVVIETTHDDEDEEDDIEEMKVGTANDADSKDEKAAVENKVTSPDSTKSVSN